MNPSAGTIPNTRIVLTAHITDAGRGQGWVSTANATDPTFAVALLAPTYRKQSEFLKPFRLGVSYCASMDLHTIFTDFHFSVAGGPGSSGTTQPSLRATTSPTPNQISALDSTTFWITSPCKDPSKPGHPTMTIAGTRSHHRLKDGHS